MNMAIICVLMVLCTSQLTLLGLAVFSILQLGKSLNKISEILNIRTKLNIDISDNMNLDMIDNLIDESVASYKIMKLEYQDDLYISEDIQNEMIECVLRDTLNKISPLVFDKLSLLYNKETVEDMILRKIKYIVMEYTIEVNGTYKK